MPWDGAGWHPAVPPLPPEPATDPHGYISGTRRAIRGVTYLFVAAFIALVLVLTT